MRPLWRDLILRVWGADPLKCPCCRGALRRIETILRPEEIEFYLRLHGLWQAERGTHAAALQQMAQRVHSLV